MWHVMWWGIVGCDRVGPTWCGGVCSVVVWCGGGSTLRDSRVWPGEGRWCYFLEQRKAIYSIAM